MKGKFSNQLGRFGIDSVEKFNRLKRNVAIRLFKSVIMDTPVLTGRLRANWQVSLNNPDLTVTEAKDASGGTAIKAVISIAKTADGDDSIWLSNSLPYAYRIEYDGWSHTKAPEGMVRKNVQRFRALLQEELGSESLSFL